MNLQRYMSNLYLLKNFDKPIGSAAKNILELFIYKNKMTVYQCCKELNIKKARYNKKIAYKNVRKTVKKLQYHNLITEVEIKTFRKPPHGSIYFELTSLGILYILENDIATQKEFIDNYKNDYLFSIILFPFISKKTIGSLSRNYVIVDILDYLKNCSHTIMSLLTRAKEYEVTHNSTLFYGLTSSITKNVNIGDQSFGPRHFIELLNVRTNIPWLNAENCVIHEIEENKKFRITDGKNELIFILYTEKFTATVYNSNLEEILKFRLEEIVSDELINTSNKQIYTIEDFVPPGIEYYFESSLPSLKKELNKNSNGLCLKILEISNNAFHPGRIGDEMRMDILMIRRDKKFVSMLKTFKKDLGLYFNRFMKMKKKAIRDN